MSRLTSFAHMSNPGPRTTRPQTAHPREFRCGATLATSAVGGVPAVLSTSFWCSLASCRRAWTDLTVSSSKPRAIRTVKCLPNSWLRDLDSMSQLRFSLTNSTTARPMKASELMRRFCMKASHSLMYSFSAEPTSQKSCTISRCFWMSQLSSATGCRISVPGTNFALLNGSKSGCLVTGT